MGQSDYYKHGDWDAICDVCGFKYKASMLRKRWDNLMVCSGDWEPRQPQDFVRGVTEKLSVPWSRPEGSDTFIGFCTPNGITAIVDFAKPDCAIVEYEHPLFDPNIDE